MSIKVEIWSDIACPWCYIGRRRFEHALNQFGQPDAVEIVWRSFQLDPTAPREYPGTINDMLSESKGISRQQAEMMHEHVTQLAAQEGLDYRFDRVRPGNSFDAHRLLHLAAQHNRQSEMKERLQQAYFTEGLPFGDPETLVQLASEVGLDADEARAAMNSDAYGQPCASLVNGVWPGLKGSKGVRCRSH
jgi:predicted DsbA family dithiol-disulfide isomerase